MRRFLFDTEAARLLLAGERPGSVRFLALSWQADIAIGLRCPYCAADTIEAADRSRRCLTCSEQWEMTAAGPRS